MKKRNRARGRAKAGAAMAAEADAEAVAGAADGPQAAFMQAALEEAYAGIEAGDGGPFGTVIVRDGEIVGRGHNRVVVNQDPTCHGEMEAIRDACKNLGTFDLSGCELYTTAEPCPMCLGATLWANIPVGTTAARARTRTKSASGTRCSTSIWRARQTC